MTVQMSAALRNARLNAIETTIGTAPVLKFFTGAIPASCATADSGTALAALTLPTDWMADASGGTKAKAGSWTGTATAAGTAGYFRLYDSSGVCHMQGTVTITGSGGDMTVDNTNFASGQTITVNSDTWTDGNA